MLYALALAVQVAASQGDATVGVVNTPRLMSESIDGQAAAARIEALRKEREKPIAEKRAAVQGLVDRKATAADIEKAQRELRRMTEDAEADLETLARSLQDEISGKVQAVLRQILQEEHFGIILEYPNPLIAWFKPSVDVTSKVLERLDAAAKAKK